MVGLSHSVVGVPAFQSKPRVLIVRSAYRAEIIDGLYTGALEALSECGAIVESVTVHGSLEIPGAIALHEKAGKAYDAYIALGCILKGDTIHDEVIAYTAYQSLQDMIVGQGLCIGCGILTVNTVEQAEERASPERQNRGREAALAALHMLSLKRSLAGK
ncbi:MAG: 6,7-dimethyl-8-ribityllumazine synthase [Pseudobdellovibrionaceae bacterium]